MTSPRDTAVSAPQTPVRQWRIRCFRSGDEAAWLELLKAAPDFRYLIFSCSPSLDALRMIIEHPSMDAAHNLWFAEANHRLVGCAELWHDEGRPRSVFKVLVHPGWRRRGLGTELLRRVEQRARSLGGTRLDVMVEQGQSGGRAFLQARRLREVHRCWDMVLATDSDVTPPQWPRGYTIRHFVTGQDEMNSVELENASFRNEWEYAPVQAGEIEGFVRSPSFRPEGVVYAVSQGTVVGECWAWIDNSATAASCHGDIWCLCVHPEHRSRGLGRALLLCGVEWLQKQGVGCISLGVDGANDGAKRLYESVGFRAARTHLWYREEL